MRRTSEDRGLYDWDANEIEEQPQSSLISKAERNISSSCQHLEQTFKDINRDFDAPCPVKLIRRLTSLEIALSQLKKDCETISSKRRCIVQSVISDQNENVGHVAKIPSMRSLGSSPAYRQDSIDSNWKELSLEMKVQLDLL